MILYNSHPSLAWQQHGKKIKWLRSCKLPFFKQTKTNMQIGFISLNMVKVQIYGSIIKPVKGQKIHNQMTAPKPQMVLFWGNPNWDWAVTWCVLVTRREANLSRTTDLHPYGPQKESTCLYASPAHRIKTFLTTATNQNKLTCFKLLAPQILQATYVYSIKSITDTMFTLSVLLLACSNVS